MLVATYNGNINNIKYLIEHGANPCCRNHEGFRLCLYNDQLCSAIFIIRQCNNKSHKSNIEKVIKKFYKKFTIYYPQPYGCIGSKLASGNIPDVFVSRLYLEYLVDNIGSLFNFSINFKILY